MKAYIYYEGKLILAVVGIKSETPEMLLQRVKGAVYITVDK